jgi:RNA recognition motif-containing protein
MSTNNGTHLNSSITNNGLQNSIAGRQLFVGNLPFTSQWQELKDLFRRIGNVVRADIVTDSQGQSRGYGQVVMGTVEDAKAAIENLNGTEFQGRSIEVREDKYAVGGASVNVGSNDVQGTQVFVGNVSTFFILICRLAFYSRKNVVNRLLLCIPFGFLLYAGTSASILYQMARP